MKRKVLLTGAAGLIGSFCAKQWAAAGSYDLRLTDVRPPADDQAWPVETPFVRADLADFDAVVPLMAEIDTVVHLGADPSMQAAWASLLPNNIIATYNVFEAAHRAGVQRVIFASSVNVVIGYPRDVQVHIDQPARPINLYGASKVWGEGVASSYSVSTALSCLCLRFGWVVDRDSPNINPKIPFLDLTATLHDVAQLIIKAIDAPPTLKYGVFHGLSDNRFKRLDISATREVLGFAPEDDGFEIAARNAATAPQSNGAPAPDTPAPDTQTTRVQPARDSQTAAPRGAT